MGGEDLTKDDNMNKQQELLAEKFREAARRLSATNGESLLVDSGAVVSFGDRGAYVTALVWVKNKDAGVNQPRIGIDHAG